MDNRDVTTPIGSNFSIKRATKCVQLNIFEPGKFDREGETFSILIWILDRTATCRRFESVTWFMLDDPNPFGINRTKKSGPIRIVRRTEETRLL